MKDISRAMPATLVASLALFVAASGTAGALAGRNNVDKDDLQKNVVTAKHVKNSSLKGADLKKDSLTGKQVKESSLGTVPSAASVQSVKFFEASLVEGESAVLLTEGSLSAVASCLAVAATTEAKVLAATTAPGAAFAGDSGRDILEVETPEADREFESNTDNVGGKPEVSNGYDDQFWIHAADGTAIYGTMAYIIDADVNSCKFVGSYTTNR